jgi:hypothetical protein
MKNRGQYIPENLHKRVQRLIPIPVANKELAVVRKVVSLEISGAILRLSFSSFLGQVIS